MKISLLTCFILFAQIVFSQEIPPDLLKKMEKTGQQKSMDDSLNWYDLSAEKGKITFTNGETATFKSIKLKEDSVSYQQPDRNIHIIPLSEVSLITEIHRHKRLNALIAGGFGLVSGLLVGVLDYPDENNLVKCDFPFFSR